VTVGGVPVAGLDPEVLRRHVVLVSQEHHVFRANVRDNLLLAALDTVGASWVGELPAGLDTERGAGRTELDGARVQQLALARVVLADPGTVILDEATALLDPAAARHTERALAAVLRGRTVIAIAHRLHTAHDELVAADGPYAQLWRTWHGTSPGAAAPPASRRAPAGTYGPEDRGGPDGSGDPDNPGDQVGAAPEPAA
jgi:ABC-type multidrug transport system fused ATPase/permease subunit